MAKRFTDTKKWEHEWFRELRPTMKCVWQYLCDACDNSGVWVVSLKTLGHFVGEIVTLEEILKGLHGKVFMLTHDRLLVAGFIRFQYGKELKENSNPHKGVLKALRDNGLTLEEIERLLEKSSVTLHEPLPKGYTTLKDKNKDKDQDKNQDQEGGTGGKHPTQTLEATFDSRWPGFEDALARVLQPVHVNKLKFHRGQMLRHFSDVDELRSFLNPYIKNLRRAQRTEMAGDEESAAIYNQITRRLSEWTRLEGSAS